MNFENEINNLLNTELFQEYTIYKKSPFLPCVYKEKIKNITPEGFKAAYKFWSSIKDLGKEEFIEVYKKLKEHSPDLIEALKESTIVGIGSAEHSEFIDLCKNHFT